MTSPVLQFGADAVFVVFAGLSSFISWAGGRRQAKSLGIGFKQLDANSERRIDAVVAAVTDVRHLVVGVDGENGLRADVREIKARVIGLEDRERDRLEQRVGQYDRRSSS